MIKLLLIILCLAYASARHIKMVEEMSVVSAGVSFVRDSGAFTNCGTSKMSGVWTPKVISSHGEVSVYINFTAPYDMDGGYVELDVYKHEDHSPVIQFGTPFSCEEIKKWIPCPLKKGQFLSLHNTFADLSQLAGYQGVFDIAAFVNNDDDQQMLCVNATVTLTR